MTAINPMQHVLTCTASFYAYANETGYEPKTTIYQDLSIAELFGMSSVQDTYDKLISGFGKDITYVAELVLCLNLKLWEHYEKRNSLSTADQKTFARFYDGLWRKAQDYVFETFSGDDIQYYYSVTD